MDLIDRQAAIDALAAMCCKSDEEGIWIIRRDAWARIDSLPSAEPKTGKWRHYEGMLTCSECASEFYDTIMEFCGDDVPHFCPDCGADMRGEKDE